MKTKGFRGQHYRHKDAGAGIKSNRGIDEIEPTRRYLNPGFFSKLGKHRDVPKSKYDSDELKKGIKVEMEHTDDPKIAEEIAKDHLEEIPDYYTRLIKMEKEAESKLPSQITPSKLGDKYIMRGDVAQWWNKKYLEWEGDPFPQKNVWYFISEDDVIGFASLKDAEEFLEDRNLDVEYYKTGVYKVTE